MDHDEGISALRSRVSALVEREGVLLTQAFELSRGSGGNGHQRLESLFAQVQALQIERNGLKKRIGNMLGTQRLHEAAEVWRPGVYDYRPQAGGDVVRVYVKKGPIGLQVLIPGEGNAVSIERLEGTFDGPLPDA